MPYGLYIAAEGASAQNLRMQVIANNLANVETTAFKRDVPQIQARFAEAIVQGLDAPGSGSINNIGGGVEVIDTVTDLSPGGYRVTGRPEDLAIRGDGYFVVRNGRDNLLTRAGNFTITATGALTTDQGYPVLDTTGVPAVIDPQLPWWVSPQGELLQDGARIPLAIVRPREPGDLVKIGNNLFQPLAATVPVPFEQRQVESGVLETSGVNPVSEMMELISASRAFESNVTLIRNHDQMIGNLISRVLSTRS